MGDPDDAELLARWRGGDRSAGEALVARHFPAVLRMFRHKVGDAADDLVQQTFLTCLEHRDGIRDGERFRGYLLRVGWSRLLRHPRARGPARPDRSDAELGRRAAPTPSATVGTQDERAQLLGALAQLPLEMQVALELYYWEEMTAGEIAAVLEVPEGTVRSRLRLGRDKLRERLAVLDPHAPDGDALEQRARAAGRTEA
ncbi:MAG: sigma-70 family RNA polymerase sigma factor [Nannocystaceae bacterium]